MVDLPWRGAEDANDDPTTDEPAAHADAVVVCECQDGTLAVYEEEVVLERVARSKFDDVTVPMAEIAGVTYEAGITMGYLQVERVGAALDSGGLLSDPVDPYTLHFQRSGRESAREARDAILERATG
jgi:hypothetical protein